MENPNLRYSAYLALRHPFLSKKSNITLQSLCPIFDQDKIIEDSINIKNCLKQLLLLNFIKKNQPEKKMIKVYAAECSKESPSLTSLENQELKAEQQRKRKLQLSSSVICDSHKKLQVVRPQRTFNVVAEHFATEATSRSTRTIIEFEDRLPAIDQKKDVLFQLSSESPTEKKPKTFAVKGKLMPNIGTGDDSPKKREKQIKEILERIVLKEKVTKENSESIYKKVTEGLTFNRTKTIDQKTPLNKSSYRRELSLNFQSARPSRKLKTEEGQSPLKTKNSNALEIFDLKHLNFTDRLKFKDKESNKASKPQKAYKIGTSSKIKYGNQTPIISLKTISQQEGGTISTQDC